MDVGLAITLGLLSCIVVIWYIWRKRRMTFFERLGIPGPKPHFIRGNCDNTSNQADLSLEWEKKYGKTYGIYLGAWPFIVTSDPELMKLVQIKEFKRFSSRARFLSELVISDPIVHDGMFTKDGVEWKNARSVISPAFTSGKLKRMMPIVREALDIFLGKIAEQGNKTFDISPLFKKLSFDINCRASFGIVTNVQNDDNNMFVRSAYRSFDADAADFLAKALVYFPELHPLPQLIRIFREKVRRLLSSPSILYIIGTCAQVIKARRENPQAGRPDLLQGLLDASEDNNSNKDLVKKENSMLVPLTDNEVLSNAVGFMIAGFDAIAVISSYCTHYLVENPQMQDKLREEIQTHIKGELEYDALGKLTYLDQIIYETLRILPFGVTGINRTATEDFKYKDIYIPKGTNVAMALHALNMNRDFWENPEVFNPDRFSPEIEINNVVYQPFGIGPRNCIGMRFAQITMKAILASLFKNYKLYIPPDAEPYELQYTIFSVRPKHGIQVRAIPVSDSA